MKKLVFFLAAALLSFSTANAEVLSKRVGDPTSQIQPKVRPVYYIVMGSYVSLKAAKAAYYNTPDGLECPIYQATSKGKIVYRHCVSCFYSYAKAQETLKFLKDAYGNRFWIWKSNGLAKCVYCPVGLSGEQLKPLKPE